MWLSPSTARFWFKECSPPPETSGPTPPTGAPRLDSQGYSALSDYLLTYSLSPALSHPDHKTYGIGTRVTACGCMRMAAVGKGATHTQQEIYKTSP